MFGNFVITLIEYSVLVFRERLLFICTDVHDIYKTLCKVITHLFILDISGIVDYDKYDEFRSLNGYMFLLNKTFYQLVSSLCIEKVCGDY